jgi:DNA-binding NarL/FixJ family response regulator
MEGDFMAGRAVVCEDDPMLRQVIESVLRAIDVDVVAEVASMPELNEVIAHVQPDVVILDLVLFGTLEIAEAFTDLVALAPRVAVVVFSAHDGLRARALEAGARAFVDKPDFDALGQAVAEVLAAASA